MIRNANAVSLLKGHKNRLRGLYIFSAKTILQKFIGASQLFGGTLRIVSKNYYHININQMSYLLVVVIKEDLTIGKSITVNGQFSSNSEDKFIYI